MPFNGIYSPVIDIYRPTLALTSGIRKLEYVEIENIYAPWLLQVSGWASVIALKAGAVWHTAYMIFPERNYSETQRRTSAGRCFDVVAKGFIPFDNYDNSRNFDIMSMHRYVVKVTLNSGIVRVMGNKDNGCEFSVIFDSGTGITDKMGTAIAFSVTTIDKPPMMQHTPNPNEYVMGHP